VDGWLERCCCGRDRDQYCLRPSEGERWRRRRALVLGTARTCCCCQLESAVWKLKCSTCVVTSLCCRRCLRSVFGVHVFVCTCTLCARAHVWLGVSRVHVHVHVRMLVFVGVGVCVSVRESCFATLLAACDVHDTCI
jgi:hypothetical protein